MQKISLTYFLIAATTLCALQPALAQTPASSPAPETAAGSAASGKKGARPPGPEKSAEPIQSVTVTGERQTNRIDRQVYDVKSDVGSTNGTAADALNNVPSVAVDPDGTVTLRGSTNVQILVDGKPSAMLQGDNRGASLNAMGADDIESIEVINNPGAQFGNEAGGGPILNLVMRRNRKPGGFASINANAGSGGRYNSSASGSYNEGAFGIQGGVSVRHDGRNSVSEVSRDRFDPLADAFVHSTQSTVAKGLNDSIGLNGTVTYNLSPNDTVAASATYNTRGNDQQSRDRYIDFDAGGAAVSDYQRTTQREGDNKSYSWGSRFDHKGRLDGELLRIDLRVSSSRNGNDSAYANVYAINPGNAFDSRSIQASDNSVRIVDFTGDYERPLAGGTVKLGYKIADNKSIFDTLYTDIDPLTTVQTVNPGRSNNFSLDETTIALYGSYQMRLNERWGALAGLRAEYTDMNIEQITSGTSAKNNYLNLIPSFFATYKVNETTNLRFSYAHRIRRPSANDLNPYVIYRDDFNVTAGNPMLKPTQTDSFELGYETKFGALDTNLRGYYRRDTDAIVERRYFVSQNVLLTTKDNGTGSHSSGLEFTVSGKLTPSLTINTSGNLAQSEQIAQDLNGVYSSRSATSLSGRTRLNYQFDEHDQLQLALQMQGKTLSGQGYRSPNSTLNLSLRHTLTPALNVVMNVTDVLNSNKMESIIDTSTLRETSVRRFDGRMIYIGLSYRIGGAAAKGEKEQEDRQGQGQRQRGPRRGPAQEDGTN